jgi:Glycosyl hydrolase family 26
MLVTSALRPRRALLLTILALVAPLGVFAGSPADAAADGPIQLGVYLPGAPSDAETLDNYSAMVGRGPDIVLVFRNLDGPLLYSSEIPNLRMRGETPMVTLEPYVGSGVASFADIAAGEYDSYFRREAIAAKDANIPILLRFAHEMNLTSSDWGPGKLGNTAATYVEAWRHIVSIFRQEGATNVQWVWAPNVDYGGKPFAQFFPGDEWVDYVGLDGYNWGTASGDSWSTFANVFASSYATITQLSTKPLIISETASSELGGSKAAWIEGAFFATIPATMPRVKAVVWFNDNKEEDWRINSSRASLEAYRRVVASSLYGGSQPTPIFEQTPPVVKELEVVPVVTGSAPALEPVQESVSRPTPIPVPAEEPAQRTGGTPKGGHRRRQHARIRVRGRITYWLSSNATVQISLRRVGRRSRPLIFTADQHAGHKRVSLARLVGDHYLRRGRYHVAVIATTNTGTSSRPRHYGFRIKAPGHRRHRRPGGARRARHR